MLLQNSRMIPRENLINLLEGLSDKRIIYICAPAGYGKTVGIRQWLEQGERASSVIALDEYDNEPARFCSRFCAALRRLQPENEALKEITVHSAFESAPVEFSIHAVDALFETESAKLFIDDLHLIQDKQTARLLLSLLDRLPECFQTVLASRNNPPSVFSEIWKDDNGISYVNADELRFTLDEIVGLHKVREVPITPDRAGDIYRFTNGWAIGVGAVLLSGGNLRGTSLEFLEEFIEKNVWQRWDEGIQEFMLKTAVVHEMVPSLCAALTGRADSESLLDDLVSQSAFILQTEQGTYRYHHLFHDFLQHVLKRRGGEMPQLVMEKAGNWYLAEGDFYRAADCFIKCENADGIAKCFDFLEVDDRNNFVITEILSVTKAIDFAAEKYPFLYYMMAWAAFAEGRASDMTRLMDNYYARFPEIAQRDPKNAHNIFFLRIIDFRSPLGSMLQEISTLPASFESEGVKGSMTINMPLIHRCTRDFSEWSVPEVEPLLAQIKSVLGGLFGEEVHLLVECMAAGLLYEQGHPERALRRALAANGEIRSRFGAESKFCAASILVLVLDALDRAEEADEELLRVAEMIEQDKAYYLNYNFGAFKIRRKLAEDDRAAADSWLNEHGTSLHDEVSFYKLYGHMTTCRAYLTKGEYDNAIILLIKVLNLAKAYNRPLDILEAQILLSAAYLKKGDGFRTDAVQYLEQALLTAYGYGYTQVFINEGAELFDMLLLIRKRSVSIVQDAADASQEREERQNGLDTVPADFIDAVCQSIQERYEFDLTVESETSPRYTDKQLTVMELLLEGKSHREIAEQMGIKHSTLRSHLAAIYRKLDVTSETEAAAKIKASGILADR